MSAKKEVISASVDQDKVDFLRREATRTDRTFSYTVNKHLIIPGDKE